MFNNQRQQPMPPFAALTEELWLARPGRLFPNRDTSFVTGTDESSAATDDRARCPTRAAGATRRDVAAKLAALLAFALVGCATPVLKQSVEVPDRFAATQAVDQEPETAWWNSYGDPVLSSLIRRAAAENRDVKIAAERVRAARAGETISRSWLFPSIGVHGAGFDHRTGYDSITKQTVPEAADTKGWQGGADVSWEIDIAGRLRAGAAASAAEALATEHTARGVRLLVMTDVATNYFTLVGALRQRDTVRAISAAQDETLRLVTARQRAGLATSFDVERAQTDASKARAAIPPLETLAAVSRHRIAVLIGDQAFNAASINPSRGEVTVPSAHAGQPANLLRRRPDLLAAQAQLDAANARRQQAMAEWFPRLFLGAMFGREGLDVNGIALGAARFTNVAAMIAMPIFNAGRTQAINDVAESRQKEAVLHYEDAIVRALEDVENTLVALDDERQRAQLMQSAAASAEAALGRAQSLYDRGQIDLLPLLDAQRVRLSVRVGANDANTQLLLDSVQLYKALGGGWEVFEPSSMPTAANAAHAPNP
jgi:NodT family efflux transporter outer membrane factor (OMF) lipoprotein